MFFYYEGKIPSHLYFLFYAPPLTLYDEEFSNGWRVSRVWLRGCRALHREGFYELKVEGSALFLL